MAAIGIQGLTKRFGDVTAVSDLSFSVREGAITGFLGPNGAGKTTTLRMLLGLVVPTAGRATIDGRAYLDLAEPLRHVGAVLESSSFHPGRRGRQHLRVLATAAGLPLGRADEVLAEVGLDDVGDRRVKGFSLGMRQRLGLACALLGSPRVLILDEPTNGLDPEGVHWLRRICGRSPAPVAACSSRATCSRRSPSGRRRRDHRERTSAHPVLAGRPLTALAGRHPGAHPARRGAAGALAARARRGGSYRRNVSWRSTPPPTQEGIAAAGAVAMIYEMPAGAPSLEELFLELTASGGER